MSSSHSQAWFGFFTVFLLNLNLSAVETAVLKINGQSVQTIGRSSCGSSAVIEIALPPILTDANNDFRVTRKELTKSETKSGCANTVTAGENQEGFSVAIPTIPQSILLTSSVCDKKGKPGKAALCIYPGAKNDASTNLVAEVVFAYDTTVAGIDQITDINAVNGSIEFTVKISGTAQDIETCYGKITDGNIEDAICPSTFKTTKSKPPKITLKGLDNNIEYKLKARIINPNAPPGDWSAIYSATPIPIVYPFNAYNGQGGNLEFDGCQTSLATSSYFLFGFLGLLLIIRRRRIAIGKLMPSALLVILCSLPAKNSHADFGKLNIGLLGAMYRPDLDSEKTKAGDPVFPVYKCFFEDKITPLLGAEIDMHLFDSAGSLQFGLGLGYTFVTGRALGLDANNQPDCNSPANNAKSSLHMYQIRPQLTYILDYFKDNFPLMPYVRGAVISHGYLFRHGDKVADKQVIGTMTNKPNGFRFGYQAAAGLMLMLDFLEPGSVRAASGSGFFEHVYLKGELSYTKIDTFGNPGLQFSAKDVMGTEFPLMWTFGLVFELP